ncbi:MAG TPA: site-specific integrase [Streptosporangiaceae bacterium]|nr:site-specific integrase [Streptosporangiaceae bacterium]
MPTSKGTRLIKKLGYASKARADAAGVQTGRLLGLASDEPTRQKIGDMIAGTKGGADLPAVDDVRRRLGLGQAPDTPGITVADFFGGWLEGKQRARRASTYRSYEMHWRVHISPVISHLPLERLNFGHVEEVLAKVPGSAGTRHRVLATLRAALNAAVRKRLIPSNPCTGIELEPENPPEQKRWTPAEAAKFIAATAGDPMGLLFRVMVLRAARRAEVCGLQWAGWDGKNGIFSVQDTLLQLGGKLTMGKPKTDAGKRLIFLDAETADLVRKHRDAQVLQALEADSAWQDNGLVFCQPDGRPWNPDHVSKRFKRLAAKAGVPVIKLHEGGRHTGNSLMYDAEVRGDIVMREVGHASREISQRYNHPLTEAHQAAAEQVAELVRKAGSTS